MAEYKYMNFQCRQKHDGFHLRFWSVNNDWNLCLHLRSMHSCVRRQILLLWLAVNIFRKSTRACLDPVALVAAFIKYADEIDNVSIPVKCCSSWFAGEYLLQQLLHYRVQVDGYSWTYAE